MKTPYRELEQRQKACSHHADFRGNQVAEAVKPLHVSLQAACFLPFTVATLERTSSEQMSWRKKGEASRSRQTWAFTLSLEIRKAAQRATGWAATGRGGGLGNLFCGRPDRALLPRETQLLRVGTALRSTIQK